MKETRKIHSDDLRNLCIKKNWYTKGTGEEYSNLLATADGINNIETQDIVRIAQDILDHSDTAQPLSSICFEIAKVCHSFFA